VYTLNASQHLYNANKPLFLNQFFWNKHVFVVWCIENQHVCMQQLLKINMYSLNYLQKNHIHEYINQTGGPTTEAVVFIGSRDAGNLGLFARRVFGDETLVFFFGILHI